MNKGPEYQLQTQHLAHPLHSSPTARGLTVFIYRAEAKRRGRQQGAQQDSNPGQLQWVQDRLGATEPQGSQ